jgi:hypothetical protein
MESAIVEKHRQGVGRQMEIAPAENTNAWYINVLLLSTFCIMAGVIWDISWHMSIGRDTLFSPPHMAIYLGGIAAGASSIWKILRTSFWGTPDEKGRAVSFWGMKAPLGTLFCIWGAGAMITSAPFDDWWHNTYGLDVKILSPPHSLLALGIAAIQIGTILNVLALQNQSEVSMQSEEHKRKLRLMFGVSFGIFLMITFIFIVEHMGRVNMHNPLFYQVACGVFPLILLSGNRASKLRWPATTIAGIYMLGFIAQLWILPLFPAEPKLAPILYRVDHMVPLPFPLLLIIPAFVLDLVMRRVQDKSTWQQVTIAGLAFFSSLLITQWFFSYFLMSPFARNWMFGTHEWPYYRLLPPTRFQFRPFSGTETEYYMGFVKAILFVFLSCWLGLKWGNWMRRVQR